MRTWRAWWLTWWGGTAIVVGALVVVFLLQVGYAMWVFSEFPGPKQMDTRGQFGDLFGAVTAFFTGLAFAGVIYTIVLQSIELGTQREAQSEQAGLLAISADLSRRTALINAYTGMLDSMEWGNFRKFLLEGEKIVRMEKAKASDLGDEEAMNTDGFTRLMDYLIRRIPDIPQGPQGPQGFLRDYFEEWNRIRRRREELLSELEKMSEQLERMAEELEEKQRNGERRNRRRARRSPS